MSKNLQWMVGVLLGSLIVQPSFASPAVKLSQVQQAIQAKKAKWTASETWVSRLPEDQIKRMLGLQRVPSHDSRFRALSKSSSYKSYVTSSGIDWRNKDGVNWVTPILNQGNCGSCVAFSSIGTLETQVNITSGIPGMNPTFSAEALFECGGATCNTGWEVGSAARYLKSTGVPDEACMPYTSGATGQDVACSSACSDRSARSQKIVNYTSPSGGLFSGSDPTAVKAALQNGPVVTTMTVYSDFLFYTGGVYKHTTGKEEGGHAVSIVGYDDAQQAWIVRNSWGPDWGDHGFVYVAYDDDSGVGDDTYSFQVAQPTGYLAIQSPSSRSFVSGKLNFNAESTFPGASNVMFTLTNTSGQQSQMSAQLSTQAGSAPGASMYASTFDSTAVADGQYDVVATVQSNGMLMTSQHEMFYVLNQAPASMSITVPSADHNLTQPLSGRIVFNVDSTTGANVPFSLLTFHAAQNGKDVNTVMAEIVVSNMTFGWESASVPDGIYDMYFTGDISTSSGAHYTTESAHTMIQVQNAGASSGLGWLFGAASR